MYIAWGVSLVPRTANRQEISDGPAAALAWWRRGRSRRELR